MKNHPLTVIITGASSGLGEEFAKQLAARSKRLILVARRAERLEKIALEIRSLHPQVAVETFPCDVSQPEERERFAKEISAQNWSPDFLVNNAGLGDYGEFISADWPRLESMLTVNISALVHFTHLLLPQMVARKSGAIINISSLASMLPIPDFAVYAATKAFVSSFSEALRIELQEHNISLLYVCPGPVKTGFGEVSRRGATGEGMPARKWFYVAKEQVVADALRALAANKVRIFPGLRIAAAATALAATPLAILRRILTTRPRKNG